MRAASASASASVRVSASASASTSVASQASASASASTSRPTPVPTLTRRLQEKFAFTWQQRLAAYRALPDGTEVPPPDGDAAAPPELLVGLIGCGALGSTVVQTLLDAGFAPSQILVSTRSPQQLQALRQPQP